MMENLKLVDSKKTKGDRLGWNTVSSERPKELKCIVGNGQKVEKDTYSNRTSKYRTLVP